MIQVSPENIFPGAKIKMGLKPLTVIKVNAKSFYAAEMSFSDYTEKFATRFPGTTFKEFCKKNNILTCKYTSDFRIEETEILRKEVAVKNTKKSKYNLDKAIKLAISQIVNDFTKKKRSLSLLQISVGNSFVRFIEIRDGNSFLLNIDKTYVLYSMKTDECVKLCSVYDYNYKCIPWEKLSCYSVTQEKKVMIA